MLNDLFDENYKKKGIGLRSIRAIKNNPLIVQVDKIKQLLQNKECYQTECDNKTYKVLRFLLRSNGELVFAHEGGPHGIVPAHSQMLVGDNVSCITAGNAYFNVETNTLELINHKSGDFRPPFDSLQFVLPQLVSELINVNIPISNTLKIEQLNGSGVVLETHQVSHEEIIEYANSHEFEDIEPDLYKQKLTNDLKLLKQFHNEKLELNSDNQFGDEYSRSIKDFYTKAIEIRESNQSDEAMARDLRQLAHNQFYHRHNTRRLIADVLMVIGMMFLVGFAVGLGRVALGGTFFFSTEKTTRERDFSEHWMCVVVVLATAVLERTSISMYRISFLLFI
jgi:hypothetical protein